MSILLLLLMFAGVSGSRRSLLPQRRHLVPKEFLTTRHHPSLDFPNRATLTNESRLEYKDEDETYTVEKVKKELLEFEVNMSCFMFGVCHYDDHYISLFSHRNTKDMPLEILMATKTLMEAKYGKKFSHPIERQHQRSKEGDEFRTRFKSASQAVFNQWAKIGNVNLLKYLRKEHFDYIPLVIEGKKMEQIVERMEFVRDRTEYLPVARYADQPLQEGFRQSINVTHEVEEMKGLVSRLFGFILNVKPGFSLASISFNDDYSGNEETSSVLAFQRAFKQLYGDLVDQHHVQSEASFEKNHRFLTYKKLSKNIMEIYTYWFEQVYMLSRKQQSSSLWHYRRLLWTRMMFASVGELDIMNQHIEMLKNETFTDAISTTFEVDKV